MNLSQNQNKFKIALIAGVVILFVILAITIIAGLKRTQAPNSSTQTPGPTINPQILIPPIQNRSPVPQTAAEIKQQILKNPILDNGDKILFTNANYRIVYVPTPDIFFIQILKDPANTARQDAQDWFTQKGLSQKDLCNLPVRFVLFNQDLKKTNPNFNYLPDGC